MPAFLLRVVRLFVTLLIVAVAAIGGRWLSIHYNLEPWTRDGRIRADIVHVAPDINGLVTQVLVKDDQAVHTGDVLFVIDQARYQLASDQADSAIAADKAALDQAIRDSKRNRALGNLVTTQESEQDASKVQQLQAQLDGAMVAHNIARLNLERTT